MSFIIDDHLLLAEKSLLDVLDSESERSCKLDSINMFLEKYVLILKNSRSSLKA